MLPTSSSPVMLLQVTGWATKLPVLVSSTSLSVAPESWKAVSAFKAVAVLEATVLV